MLKLLAQIALKLGFDRVMQQIDKITPAPAWQPPVPAEAAALPYVTIAGPPTRNRFFECVEHILKSEGGFVNHPRDNGKATNFGITMSTLAHFRGRPVTVEDVRTMLVSEAREIYMVNYWNAVRASDLPLGLDLCMFDFAVHSGPGTAGRFLQRALGNVTVDGAIGPQTLRAVADADLVVLITRIMSLRLAMMKAHEDWDVFGRGWGRRAEYVLKDSLDRLLRS